MPVLSQFLTFPQTSMQHFFSHTPSLVCVHTGIHSPEFTRGGVVMCTPLAKIVAAAILSGLKQALTVVYQDQGVVATAVHYLKQVQESERPEINDGASRGQKGSAPPQDTFGKLCSSSKQNTRDCPQTGKNPRETHRLSHQPTWAAQRFQFHHNARLQRH